MHSPIDEKYFEVQECDDPRETASSSETLVGDEVGLFHSSQETLINYKSVNESDDGEDNLSNINYDNRFSMQCSLKIQEANTLNKNKHLCDRNVTRRAFNKADEHQSNQLEKFTQPNTFYLSEIDHLKIPAMQTKHFFNLSSSKDLSCRPKEMISKVQQTLKKCKSSDEILESYSTIGQVRSHSSDSLDVGGEENYFLKLPNSTDEIRSNISDNSSGFNRGESHTIETMTSNMSYPCIDMNGRNIAEQINLIFKSKYNYDAELRMPLDIRPTPSLKYGMLHSPTSSSNYHSSPQSSLNVTEPNNYEHEISRPPVRGNQIHESAHFHTRQKPLNENILQSIEMEALNIRKRELNFYDDSLVRSEMQRSVNDNSNRTSRGKIEHSTQNFDDIFDTEVTNIHDEKYINLVEPITTLRVDDTINLNMIGKKLHHLNQRTVDHNRSHALHNCSNSSNYVHTGGSRKQLLKGQSLDEISLKSNESENNFHKSHIRSGSTQHETISTLNLLYTSTEPNNPEKTRLSSPRRATLHPIIRQPISQSRKSYSVDEPSIRSISPISEKSGFIIMPSTQDNDRSTTPTLLQPSGTTTSHRALEVITVEPTKDSGDQSSSDNPISQQYRDPNHLSASAEVPRRRASIITCDTLAASAAPPPDPVKVVVLGAEGVGKTGK